MIPAAVSWQKSLEGLWFNTLPFILMPQKNILIFFCQRKIILYKSVPPWASI